jgi:hypothetical protein
VCVCGGGGVSEWVVSGQGGWVGGHVAGWVGCLVAPAAWADAGSEGPSRWLATLAGGTTRARGARGPIQVAARLGRGRRQRRRRHWRAAHWAPPSSSTSPASWSCSWRSRPGSGTRQPSWHPRWGGAPHLPPPAHCIPSTPRLGPGTQAHARTILTPNMEHARGLHRLTQCPPPPPAAFCWQDRGARGLHCLTEPGGAGGLCTRAGLHCTRGADQQGPHHEQHSVCGWGGRGGRRGGGGGGGGHCSTGPLP